MSAPETSAADDPLADAIARLDRAVSRVGARLEDYQLRLSAAAGILGIDLNLMSREAGHS